jgi:hypothetical protein
VKRVPITERQRRISEGLRLAWKRRKENAMLREEHDPYADLIAANRDELLRMHQEAARRVGACLCRATDDSGQLSVWHHIEVAQAVLDALNTFHPMHAENWCGWPEGSEP